MNDERKQALIAKWGTNRDGTINPLGAALTDGNFEAAAKISRGLLWGVWAECRTAAGLPADIDAEKAAMVASRNAKYAKK